MLLRLGTRPSALARTQSGHVAVALQAATGIECETVVIRSAGEDLTVPLHGAGRPGLFVAALRDRLLAGEVDLVVHSYKDLPSATVPGLVVAAVPKRMESQDVLISATGATLAQLPAGARVGTSSPRRTAALQRHHERLQAVPVRGNVDTRIAMVDQGRIDAVILARAGLVRLGRQSEATEVLDVAKFVPAPAQGALAVECRAGDAATVDLLRCISDADSEITVAAERAVLVGVQAACTTAIGARSWITRGQDTTLHLHCELTNHRGVSHAAVTLSAELGAPELVRRTAADLGLAAATALLSR